MAKGKREGCLTPLVAFTAVLLLGVLGLMLGCDTVQVRYGDASYTRTTFLSDKSMSDVAIQQDKDGFRAGLGKSDTATRVELLEATKSILELVH